MKEYTASLKSIKYFTREVRSDESTENVTTRQERVPGFDQSVMDGLTVLQIGAGGLGGEIAQGLVRKGVGLLKILDGDTVEISNLSRQFFYQEDLYKNKALSLAKNLVKEGVNKSLIVAHPYMIQKAVEDGVDISCDIAICAPDNDETRVYISHYFHGKAPVIFTGLDRNANTGYIFVQEPSKACFGCAFPNAVSNKRTPCPNTPAIIDLVKTIAGYVLFSIDSTIMKRKRNWNYRQLFMGGFVPEIVKTVDKKEICPLCKGLDS
jgi:molybdopterin/thiamine biosynthesis adenylyltransferase